MRRSPNWMALAMDGWSLGMETATVVGLRMLRLSGGGAVAAAEAERMVVEKLQAAADLGMLAMTGGLGASCESAAAGTVRHYRAKVKANRRRLTAKCRAPRKR